MKKKTAGKSGCALTLLEELWRISSQLAPVPASADGYFLDPDFRHLSVKLPAESVVLGAVSELEDLQREELVRRYIRLREDWGAFVEHRRRWRREVDSPIEATRGKMGELSNPEGMLKRFAWNLDGDIVFVSRLVGRPSEEFIGYKGGVSQQEFAKLIGKDVRTIKRWEETTGYRPKVYDYYLKKWVTYSKQIRTTRASAVNFVRLYHFQRQDAKAIKNAMQYREGETDEYHIRQLTGYASSMPTHDD